MPRRHVVEFNELLEPEKIELNALLAKVEQYFQHIGSKVIAFQHCTSVDTRRQCVEHLHVHVLPVHRERVGSLEAVVKNADGTDCEESESIRVFFQGRIIKVPGRNAAERLRVKIEE